MRGSETSPDSFVLDVFFNAQPTPASAADKARHKPTNALVATSLAYAGAPTQYDVDMGSEVRPSLPPSQ